MSSAVMQVRMPTLLKWTLEQAAQVEGTTLSGLVRDAALERAVRVLLVSHPESLATLRELTERQETDGDT